MAAGEDEIFGSIRFDRAGVAFSKWPKLSCSAANELTVATDDPNSGAARLAIAGALKLQIGVAVNELSSDDKLTNNSDLAIPTQKAVKTYVDSQMAVVNQTLSTKAALTGASSQDFQSKNLSVSGNLTANGNVSIGTTSSSYKLAIASGDINIDDSHALRQVGRWIIGGDSNVLSIGSSDASAGRDIRFDPGFAGALTIKKDTGNVGIGTANPTTTLDIDGDLRIREPSSIGNIHLFLADECVSLWGSTTGGEHIIDTSSYVPAIAKGAVIRVIVNSNSDGTGSFVCADRNGNYSNLAHYSQNGFTNYSSTWVGGVVFCPFYKDKAFKWKMVSNNADPSPVASSYGSLIGWF